MTINTVDLSGVELSDDQPDSATLEQEHELGQIVETPDGPGIVAAFVEEPFEFPVGQSEGQIEEVEEEEEPEMKEVDASEDEPMYIVALQDGGSVAVTAEEIDGDASLEGDDGADITDWEDVEDEGSDAELAPVYEYCDDPSNIEELYDAKRRLIQERHAAALADHIESNGDSLDDLEQYSYEELVNIRGVDDPHVGFDELPPGWTRKSVLQAWASLGGMWRTCFPRMVRVRGPNFAKRWCAALKDEVLRTEEWRGKF
jgi:hypothetical protein